MPGLRRVRVPNTPFKSNKINGLADMYTRAEQRAVACVGASSTTQWAHVPSSDKDDDALQLPPWRRFALVPAAWRPKAYRAREDVLLGFAVGNGARLPNPGWALVSTLDEKLLIDSPVNLLLQWTRKHGAACVPYFHPDDVSCAAVASSGHVVALTPSKSGLHVQSLSTDAFVPVDGKTNLVAGALSSYHTGVATFDLIVSDTDGAIPAASSASSNAPPPSSSRQTKRSPAPALPQWTPFLRYYPTRIDRERRARGLTEEDARAHVTTFVLRAGRPALALHPSTRAVWLNAAQLLVVRYGRASVVEAKDVDELDATLARLPFVNVPGLTEHPQWFRPPVLLPGSQVFNAAVVDGRGSAVLLVVTRGGQVLVQDLESSVQKAAETRVVRERIFTPGDVLVQHKTAYTDQAYVVEDFVPGTVALRELTIDGALSTASVLNAADMVTWIQNGSWSMLRTPIVDVASVDNTLWVMAGQTRLWTAEALVGQPGHRMEPCGAFSLRHRAASIGADASFVWTCMLPESSGLPLVLSPTAPVQLTVQHAGKDTPSSESKPQ